MPALRIDRGAPRKSNREWSLREMGGGFRFGVPLCGGLVCSENEWLALQAAFTSSVCEDQDAL